MGKSVAIVQSSYIPWKGYFDLVNSVDEFILYDDAQFTKRDWRSRNRIKTPQGPLWLTVPIKVKGRYEQKVREAQIDDPGWARQHWKSIRMNYTRAPHFDRYAPRLEEAYAECGQERFLSNVNYRLLRLVCGFLGIDTRLSWSMDYELPREGTTRRLVAMCEQAGADHYLSGPTARDYLEQEQFALAGITVSFMSYDGYPEYEQLYPPFRHDMTVLDLLFSTGQSFSEYMLSF